MKNLPYVEAHMEHYNDLRREADQARLVREARQDAGERNSFYRRTLAWIRCRFMGIGQRLNRKISEARPRPTWNTPEQPVIRQFDC